MAKVTVKRAFPDMPGAQAGQEIDAPDDQVERWIRDGHVERSQAQGDRLTRPSGQQPQQNQNQTNQGGDKPNR